MAFDVDTVGQDMLVAIKGVLLDRWAASQEAIETFLEGQKKRLKLIADARIEGEIDDEFVEERLSEEKILLQSEMAAIRVISVAAAQQAANAAVGIIQKAIKTALEVI
ncbi:MAG: hypothetical protein JST70_17460 [Bacteroidetes bacterium]|nr:hypothetical protein [Bacteroidota bacterium]